MPPTIRYDPGDIVLVRFPFSDLRSSKRRPALILSRSDFASRHGDVVLLALTSKDQSDDELTLPTWRQAGLLKPTWFKPLIASVASNVIVRPLGKLPRSDWPRASLVLRSLIADGFLG